MTAIYFLDHYKIINRMKKLASLSICLLALIHFSFAQGWGSGMTGEGPAVEKTLQLNAFEGVKLGISATVYITKGSQQSVEIKGQQNIIDNIKTNVNDGVWNIGFEERVRKHDQLVINITVPSINMVYVSGSGDIIGKSAFSGIQTFTVGVSGSGDIEFEAQAQETEVKISGSGDISLKGSSQQANFRISGSGDIESRNFQTTDSEVSINGSGDATVHATGTLNVRISGSGDVEYRGKPRINTKISGSGDVEKIS